MDGEEPPPPSIKQSVSNSFNSLLAIRLKMFTIFRLVFGILLNDDDQNLYEETGSRKARCVIFKESQRQVVLLRV